jgi:apolipoprotein N-acyltransferase
LRPFAKFAPRSAFAALLLGGLSAVAFEPLGIWPVMPLALALLCALISRAGSLPQALLTGWLFGVGQFTVGLNWIATAFTFQAAMPAWLGWLAVLLLSLYLAIYPSLAAGLAWRFGRRRPLALVLGFAGAWAITEWLRATMFTGFAWNPLAAAGVDETRFLVPLVGTYGASAFVALFGGTIWLVLEKDSRPLLLTAAAGTAVGLSVGYVFEPPRANGARAVRIIQPNIGQEDKWRPGFGEEAARRLAALSAARGGTRPRLLFWPEAAVTEPLEDQRSPDHQAFAQFERTRAAALVRQGEYLLTGGIAVFSTDGRVDGAANSVFLLSPDGRPVARYDKAHLVPYGEYLPMRPLLSSIGLSRLAPGDSDFIAGPGAGTLDLPGWGRVGLQICYEIIFSGQVVDRKRRPHFIFNPSNDAWFGRWGPPQHLAQARLRAAEEGLPVLRSTPTGISAIIDSRGRVVQSLPWQTAGVIDGSIPARTPLLTPFARFGNVIPLVLAFGLLIAGIALGTRQRYRAT